MLQNYRGRVLQNTIYVQFPDFLVPKDRSRAIWQLQDLPPTVLAFLAKRKPRALCACPT